jgi:hypothetical protein
MAWSNTDQKHFKLNNGSVETGHLHFVTSGVTLEVPTKFTKIYSGFGVTTDNFGVTQDFTITAGCVTFTRASGGASAAGFDYVLFGR